MSYGALAVRSNQVANWLRGLGARRGDRLLLMLGNIAPLWEVILAAMKLGAVIIPASTLLGPEDLADRVARGGVRHVVDRGGAADRFARCPAAGPGSRSASAPAGRRPRAGMRSPTSAAASERFIPDGVTRASDPLLLYFTSGTTAQPKLVEHTHASYPVGHLSTMYWIGLQPGDVHLNISSPGWAKHAWSNVFAPWNAGRDRAVARLRRGSPPQALLERIGDYGVTTFCAPPDRVAACSSRPTWPAAT